MPRVILDPTILAHLINIKETVELCDPDGHIVGQFTPTPDPRGCEWGRPPLSDEELAARKREGGRSLAEIMADLEKPV
jgi:hypothetical protein